ncbi:MAG: hypothetical protein WA996_11630 [Candidatus Promineifilaceae bacterium]
MNDKNDSPSFWSRSSVRWVATVLLAVVFILALIVLLAAGLVSRDLLDPDLYTNALEEENIYNRIYTELLADPALVEATVLMLGNLNLDPSLANQALSFTTSTLYLVLPPETIQSGVEGAINHVTAYFSGDAEELRPEITLVGLDPEVITDRILDGALAFMGELIAGAISEQQAPFTEMDQAALTRYLTEIDSGIIGAIPPEVAAASLEDMSPEQRDSVREILMESVEDTASPETLLQIDAALRANDLHSALALAARELLREQVEVAAEEFASVLRESEALNAVTSTAGVLQMTTTELIDRANKVRSTMIFLDQVAIPVAFVVMILSLAAIVWIHADNLTEMLRTTGVVLIVASGSVALAWLILGFVLRDYLANRFLASSALPSSLENMIADLVSNLTDTVWQGVWQTATIPVVLGLALLILSFLPRLPEMVERWLKPVWQYRKPVIVGVVLAIILVPFGLRLLFDRGPQQDLVCNGHADLCDRPVNEVAYATTHNAMSIADYGWIWPSHDGSITNQLNAGVRGFLIDSHYWDDPAWIESQLDALPPELQTAVQDILNVIELSQEDGTYLCHMMCGLGGTDLTETLDEMRQFLDTHPNEVIIIVFEDLVSSDDTEKAFEESGLDTLVYTYQPGDAWPTLREMIESNQRVLVMAEDQGPPPEWYLHAWDYTEETPYAFSELADIDDTSCEPNRGDTDKPFFLLNHWITRASPSRVDAAVINDYDYLLERAQRCAEERGQLPNLVGVNFYLNGEVFEVVDELNGVRPETDR